MKLKIDKNLYTLLLKYVRDDMKPLEFICIENIDGVAYAIAADGIKLIKYKLKDHIDDGCYMLMKSQNNYFLVYEEGVKYVNWRKVFPEYSKNSIIVNDFHKRKQSISFAELITKISRSGKSFNCIDPKNFDTVPNNIGYKVSLEEDKVWTFENKDITILINPVRCKKC